MANVGLFPTIIEKGFHEAQSLNILMRCFAVTGGLTYASLFIWGKGLYFYFFLHFKNKKDYMDKELNLNLQFLMKVSYNWAIWAQNKNSSREDYLCLSNLMV